MSPCRYVSIPTAGVPSNTFPVWFQPPSTSAVHIQYGFRLSVQRHAVGFAHACTAGSILEILPPLFRRNPPDLTEETQLRLRECEWLTLLSLTSQILLTSSITSTTLNQNCPVPKETSHKSHPLHFDPRVRLSILTPIISSTVSVTA